MAIVINGDGTITGLSAGGLPDASVATADIADNAVTLAKMVGGTDGQVITYDASGDPAWVGPGTDGQVLTSTGAGSPPAFEAISSSPYGTVGASVYLNGAQTIATGTNTKVTFNAEIYDPNSDFASNEYTVPETGKYLAVAQIWYDAPGANSTTDVNFYVGGSLKLYGRFQSAFAGGLQVNHAAILDLSATNVVSVYVYHSKGSNCDITGLVNSTKFTIQRIA